MMLTSSPQSKRINWTVEWLHDDKTSSIGSIFDDEQIKDAYLPLHLKRIGAPRKKRKRDEGSTISSGNLDVIQDISTPSSDALARVKAEYGEGPTLERDHEAAIDQASLSLQADQDGLKSSSATAADPTAAIGTLIEVDAAIMDPPQEKNAAVREAIEGDEAASETKTLPNFHYYLVKPRTSGAEKVLLPLSPTDTFLTCLQNQTVLEFPTVQVLGSGPEELPNGFITEDAYLAERQKEDHEMEQLIKEEGEVDDKVGQAALTSEVETGAVPNSSTLLATLERDMQRQIQ